MGGGAGRVVEVVVEPVVACCEDVGKFVLEEVDVQGGGSGVQWLARFGVSLSVSGLISDGGEVAKTSVGKDV